MKGNRVDVFTEQSVKDAIICYKQNIVQQRMVEKRLQTEEIYASDVQLRALKQLKKRNEMVEEWLSILSVDEAFVIQNHLIDGLDWQRVQALHIERWGELGRSARTLVRYQKRAIVKIVRFMKD